MTGEKTYIIKVYMGESVVYDWSKERQEMRQLEEKLDKNVICHRFYSTYTRNTLPVTLLRGLETSKYEDK